MKKIVAFICVLVFSFSALAVPRSLYLASPKSIEVSGNKVKLSFELPCKNEYPDEWAGNLIAVSDDEGDMAIALGVVLSKESCQTGPNKIFVFEHSLTEIGVTAADLKNGLTFEPIQVAKQVSTPSFSENHIQKTSSEISNELIGAKWLTVIHEATQALKPFTGSKFYDTEVVRLELVFPNYLVFRTMHEGLRNKLNLEGVIVPSLSDLEKDGEWTFNESTVDNYIEHLIKTAVHF